MDFIFIDSEQQISINTSFSEALIVDFSGNPNTTENIINDLRNKGIKWTEIPFLKEFEKNKNELKNTYLKWIAEISQKKIQNVRILDFLKLDAKFSLWWTTLLAEKNPLKSDSVCNSLKLMLLEQLLIPFLPIIKKGYIISSSKSIGETVRDFLSPIPTDFFSRETGVFWEIRKLVSQSTFLSGLYVFGREFYRTFLARKLLKPLSTKKLSVMSYYPDFCKESMKAGRFVSKYWGKMLTDVIENESGCNHLLFFAANSEVSFSEAVEQVSFFQNHNASNNFYLLEQFNKFSDLISIFFVFLKFAKKFSCVIDSSLFCMRNSKLNLLKIHRDDLKISLQGSELANSLIRFNKFERFFQHIGKDSVFLYLMEMQGWETIANYCFKKHHGACSIGVIHATVKNMMLNYFNDQEAYFETDYPLPTPNKICCNTCDSLGYFKSQGFQNLLKVEAQRFSYLVSFQDKLRKMTSENILLVATSINRQESEALLQMLAKANIRARLPFSKIIVKGHPDLPLGPIIEKIGNFPAHELSKKPITELLNEASTLLTTNSSSVMVEGLMIGLKTISLIDLKTLNMSAVEQHPLLFFVKNDIELADAFLQKQSQENPLKDFFYLSEDLSMWKNFLNELREQFNY